MFPSKEEAVLIAKSELPSNVQIHRVTDKESELGRAYFPPPGCWYIVYTINREMLILESSSYIAISKVDGRVIIIDSLNDEG